MQVDASVADVRPVDVQTVVELHPLQGGQQVQTAVTIGDGKSAARLPAQYLRITHRLRRQESTRPHHITAHQIPPPQALRLSVHTHHARPQAYRRGRPA
ncbi:hypothetical protein Scel_00480 [Streptomyces cellostaticus]|nr:hypothetical protein Scel_00480 [Streptomyces cellostaticus]